MQPIAAAKPRKKLRLGIPWVAAIAILGIIFAGMAVWYLKPPEPRKIMQFRDEIPEEQRLHTMYYGALTLAVSPDGDHFVYRTNEGLFLRSMGELDVKLIVESSEDPHSPAFSPDGQWIAYSSNESGQYEIYVRPFPDMNSKLMKASAGGGTSPLWSPKSRELFYRNGDSIMTVTMKEEPNLSFGKPEVLFSGYYVSPLDADKSQQTMWDIHPDGKRFLMIKPPYAAKSDSAGARPEKINIILNWNEELKERVPTQ